jgi:epsin
MDDFVDEPAATPATKGFVEPQADLFGDADFQSAIPSAETASHQDVQVRFSNSLYIQAAKYVFK